MLQVVWVASNTHCKSVSVKEMGLGDIIKQATNKLTYKISEATYDPKAETAALQAKAVTPVKVGSVNQDAFNAYKGQWGARATTSGMINPVFFKTYESILAIQPPPENADQATYDAAVNTLAQTIKAWYVGAKYRGNLNELAFTIDSTKPKYTPPSGVKAAAVKPVKPVSATDQFMKGFLNTLGITLLIVMLIFLCLLAGSLAANDAISRSSPLRVVSFIYAAIPFYTPFALIYYLYRYFKGTYPKYYNFLPVTTYKSTNKFVGILLWAFTYIEDANAISKKNEYDELGRKLVWQREPETAEKEEAAAEANAEIAAMKRAGITENLGQNNGRMNNEVVATAISEQNNNGRMNNEIALNLVAKSLSEPKPVSPQTE